VLKDYKPKAVVGKGAFGQVIRAKHRTSKKEVAIKMIEVDSNPLVIHKVIREVSIMKQLSAMKKNCHTV